MELKCNECGKPFGEPEEYACPCCGPDDICDPEGDPDDLDIRGISMGERQEMVDRFYESMEALMAERGWHRWPGDDFSTFHKGTIELKYLCFGCISAWIRVRCGESYEIRRTLRIAPIEREPASYIADRVYRQALCMAKMLEGYMGICQRLDMHLNEVLIDKEGKE